MVRSGVTVKQVCPAVCAGDGDNCIRVLQPAATEGGAGMQEAESGSVGLEVCRSSWELAACVEEAHQADVNCVQWHPQQAGLLASCGDDSSIRLWEYASVPVST